ncbi:MAG: ATP-binding protein [Bacteroidetes bacterium]|jgi:NadR type nicotinamide-nucleotide adenylyltransferase|nr:ATP-binding protein [Bacteroidota bacterium]MBT6685501.1 ATP-binding protein [Bacteroidota bacterium]MBT7144359.1 ATP-binding protein [Bacteroidota bacterium]MBT7491801.1 ATP-binding protein [Bacteroidota bacterium]
MSLIRIVITGPESTGKTLLSKQLAEHFKTDWIPEYAREYVENLDRAYTFEDVEKIAKKQIETDKQIFKKTNDLVFIDTWLIITKVWFTEVYKNVPDWIHEHIISSKIDLFLLCKPDIEWAEDPLRENKNKRDYLFQKYKAELDFYKFKYEIVSGTGKNRFLNALKLIEKI